jgi:hypothetical protein
VGRGANSICLEAKDINKRKFSDLYSLELQNQMLCNVIVNIV